MNPTKYIAIDEEGFPYFGELKVQDPKVALDLLNNLSIAENGAFQTLVEGEPVYVEAFDAPIMVEMVDIKSPEINLKGLFGFEAKADLETLCVDEWDRFHGKTKEGIPFVLTRKAQAKLFDQLLEFDDDSITIPGKKIPVTPWLIENPDIEYPAFWTNVYNNETPRWELNQASPALQTMLPKLKLPKSRVLVLGCGTGEDAAFFAKNGHIVTAVDFSDEAIKRAKKKFNSISNLTFVHQNIFDFAHAHSGQFDVVFEHTCYCAVNPSRRNNLAQLWKKVLAPGGHLMGVFFTMEKRQGPPWGGSEWEIRERIKKDYQFLFWGRWKESIDRREGRELFVYALKK